MADTMPRTSEELAKELEGGVIMRGEEAMSEAYINGEYVVLDPVSFNVVGKPIPEGSTRAVTYRRNDGSTGTRILHGNDNLYEWRYAIAKAYEEAQGGRIDGSVYVELHFSFLRPKSVSVKKRPDMTVKPDLDKLIRAFLDALTGLAYADDSQVTVIIATKDYSQIQGVRATVGRLL